MGILEVGSGARASSGFEPLVIGPRFVEQSGRELAGAVLGCTDGDARTLLHETLTTIQPDPYTWTPGSREPDLQFDSRDGLQEAILCRIMVVDALPADWEVEPNLRGGYRRCLRRALDRLAAVDAEMHRSVTTVIAAFLFARLPHCGGGSNSGAVGCVWLNPASHWTDEDWIENIFHEYVHQCLFIADMRYGLFEVDGEILAEDDALVRSALLKTPRPYDRAYHSCFVSFALVQLNMRLAMPERVFDHVQPLQTTLDELMTKSAYLTPYGLGTLESLRTAFAAFRAAHSR